MVGAGVAGRMLLGNSTLGPEMSACDVVAVVDDNPEIHGTSIFGVKIVGGLRELPRVVEAYGAGTVIVASSSRNDILINRVLHLLRDVPIRLLRTPTYEDLMCGMPIDELWELFDHLGNNANASTHQSMRYHPALQQKSVLVTGAGGSIGSEIVRQLAASGCERIICLDRDESHLVSAILRASKFQNDGSLELLLVDIRDKEALNSAISGCRPEVVIHTAALKHVSILEKFPLEAWKTNVLGTINLIQAAQVADIRAFVNVSTDKAASPCNALGYSKLITERLLVGAVRRNPEMFRKWHSVRFGNVTRSRGSVFETFERQATTGGPLTVSHPEVRRFFISIERAASFVLESLDLASAAETLIPSMPAEIRIWEIATRIAARFDPAPKIVVSGLKPGEKLSEVLYADEDGPARTTDQEGVIAVTQKALDLEEVLDKRVNSQNALETMQQLCE